MSIQNEIDRIKENIASAYSIVEERGGAVPEDANSDNLPNAVSTIPEGQGDVFLVNAPIGVIVAWSGAAASIPEGWHICDGTNGTKDLRDKFLLGAGTKHSSGEVGGSEEVTLTVEQLPEHTHSIDGHLNRPTSMTNASGATVGNPSTEKTVLPASSAGAGQPHSNMPPYYSLFFIQKISAAPTDYTTREDVAEMMQENVYSTEETRIGTWIDGKPLYRRTILKEDAIDGMGYHAEDIELITNVYGMCSPKSPAKEWSPLPYSFDHPLNGPSTVQLSFISEYGDIFITYPEVLEDWFITIEYTKSTD